MSPLFVYKVVVVVVVLVVGSHGVTRDIYYESLVPLLYFRSVLVLVPRQQQKHFYLYNFTFFH